MTIDLASFPGRFFANITAGEKYRKFQVGCPKRNIEFQIDQSHSAKLSGLPNAIGQFTFQYCVFVDNQLEIYSTAWYTKKY